MNRILLSALTILICSSSFLSQEFKIISENDNSLHFQYHLTQKPFQNTILNGENFINFSATHSVILNQKGAPKLPTFSQSILIAPKGKTAVSVTFDGYQDYTNVNVLPSKGNLKKNLDPDLVAYEFGTAYQTNAFYPGNLYTVSDPFLLREERGQTITVYPYQYNPVTKTLRVYENLKINVTNNPGETGMNELTQKPAVKSTEGISRHLFLNGKSIQKYTPKAESGEMLIISPSQFVATIQPLADWKNQKGIHTTIVTTDMTGTTDESIKSFLVNYYAAHPDLLYLLLIGDHEDIPAHYYGISWDEELYSDTYYAQLAGNDFYPELFVGRLSGNTSQITTMTNRILEYEKSPKPGNWMMQAIGLGSGEGEGYGDDNEADWQHLRNIKDQLVQYSYIKVYEFYDGSRGLDDAPGNPNAAMISDALNSGVGLFNYTGHGDNHILNSGNYTTMHVKALENYGKYPFFVSVACNNGKFMGGDCIAEEFLRAKKNDSITGAIAACGSSILMAWAQPMQTQDEMTNIITEANVNNTKVTLGGLFYNAQIGMMEQYPDTDGKEVMQTWIFFGDPSVEFRNKLTQNLTATHVSQISQETTNVNVNCNIENALISISQNNVLIGKGNITGGSANISFNTLSSSLPLTVTATKQNYSAYQGTVQVGNGGLGVSSLTMDNILIYPNPADQLLNVKLPEGEYYHLQLIDITGKVVQTIKGEKGILNYQFDVKDLAPGMYQLLIQNDNGSGAKKIIIR